MRWRVESPPMAHRVRISDVSPRDGLQNEAGVIAVADKATLVRLLAASGVDEVEVTSFVSPKWVPQLGDAAELLALLNEPGRRRPPVFSVLTPNAKGMEGALAGPVRGAVDRVAVFTAASETFSKRNTNASIAETIERFRPVVGQAQANGLPVRGYISCVIACPFEGPVAPEKVTQVAAALIDIGVDEIDLGDTIGAGDETSVGRLLEVYGREIGLVRRGVERLTLHLHDTFGRAASCVRVALAAGVRSFDGSVAGLGGCPYASTPQRRAPGNIDTALLVRTVHEAGYETGVDLAALERAAEHARAIIAAARSGVTS